MRFVIIQKETLENFLPQVKFYNDVFKGVDASMKNHTILDNLFRDKKDFSDVGFRLSKNEYEIEWIKNYISGNSVEVKNVNEIMDLFVNVEEEVKEEIKEEIQEEKEGKSETKVHYVESDLQKMTMPELRDLAKNIGVYRSTRVKSEVVSQILTANSD